MVINKSTFIYYLNQPNLVGSDAIVGLNEIVQDYPYFQSAHMLRTKAYHSSENLNFESSLKKTAAYVANRQQLHHLLFSTTSPLKSEEVVANTLPEQPLPEQKIEPVKEQHLPVPPSAFQQEVQEFSEVELLPIAETPEGKIQPNPEQFTEESTFDFQENKLPEETLEEKPTILEEERFSIDFSKIEESQKDVYDALEHQILSSAVSNSILQNVSDEIPDIDSLNTERLDKTPIKVVKTVDFKEEKSQKLRIDDAVDSYSFTDWLKALDDPNPEFEEPDEEEYLCRSRTLRKVN